MSERNWYAQVDVGVPRRAMAGLAAVYSVYAGVLAWSFGAFDLFMLAVFAIAAVILALPALAAGPDGFDVACWAVAVLILIVGCWLAIAGFFLLYPAVLPLALAARSRPMARHPWPLILTGVVIAAAPLAFLLAARP
ncbi:hypothetical protein [Actinoplanes regularis]|uniref:Uncharacterized protein n=1 Tax=Actinoplanes regularis TaxID=52697 RepID=A0A239JN66_9ACTN|nr:hypothetical protein [Actinoplanes regularis]GIE92095.1 hypothetical protein Are01nite_85750 [Actinoplanes regularis]SNT07255.1 hypothetical protein SAMN06264365_13658 [Actinoplanes regularis]